MTGGESMLLTVEGDQPTVALEPTFGPLIDVRWTHDQGMTTFGGVGAGSELRLTMTDGDSLRFTDELGTVVLVRLWNATGYTLENVAADAAQGAATTVRR